MKQLKRYTIIGILFVLISGSLAHFFYEWSGHNPIVGLFTPVNESIWEHMKLLFSPMLAYSLFMVFKLKADYPCIRSALCFGILAGTLCIPILFYTYTALLGKDIFILETKNPVFSMLSSVKCRNSQEINDFSTLSDTLFYPLSQNQKYLQSGFHPNPEGYRKSTVRLDNC